MTLAQTKLRQLRDRQSKERGRVAELAVADALTDGNARRAGHDRDRHAGPRTPATRRHHLRSRPRKPNSATAGAAGDTPGLDDAEDRERAELRGKARMGRYVQAAIEMRAVDGAEGELNAAVGIGANRFPLELLAPPERRTEDRETTGADIQTMPRTWLDRLFAETAAMRLGITMESVPAGSASFPVTTAGASAAQRGKDQGGGGYRLGRRRDRTHSQAQRRDAQIQHRGHRPNSRPGVGADARPPHGVDRGRGPGDVRRRLRGNPERGAISSACKALRLTKPRSPRRTRSRGLRRCRRFST